MMRRRSVFSALAGAAAAVASPALPRRSDAMWLLRDGDADWVPANEAAAAWGNHGPALTERSLEDLLASEWYPWELDQTATAVRAHKRIASIAGARNSDMLADVIHETPDLSPRAVRMLRAAYEVGSQA